jgi:hypothetical protein
MRIQYTPLNVAISAKLSSELVAHSVSTRLPEVAETQPVPQPLPFSKHCDWELGMTWKSALNNLRLYFPDSSNPRPESSLMELECLLSDRSNKRGFIIPNPQRPDGHRQNPKRRPHSSPDRERCYLRRSISQGSKCG